VGNVVRRGCRCVCCIRHTDGATCEVGVRDGGIASTIHLYQGCTRGGVVAGGGGGDAGMVRLRNSKAVYTDRLCRDIRGGNGAVIFSFRSVIING